MVKAFGDMGHTARLRIIRDHFIAGHDSRRFGRPGPEMALPIYTVNDVGSGEMTGSWRLLLPRRQCRIS